MIGAAFTRGELRSVFTQCSQCETVFKLSADVLRAASGQVRCGNCGEVFNALARLAEPRSACTRGERNTRRPVRESFAAKRAPSSR